MVLLPLLTTTTALNYSYYLTHQSFSTAFDAAFEEIWLAFSAGATLVCATAEMMASGADLVDTIRALRITVLDTTPVSLTLNPT
jgi:non-ribosomal peptide synthetase component F